LDSFSFDERLAYLVLYFNVPIANISDITRLQRDFIVYSKGEINKVKPSNIKTKQYEFSGKTMTIGDLLKKMGVPIPNDDSR